MNSTPNSESLHDKAITILRLTSDGDDLASGDLKLVEIVVNGKASALGLETFDRLHSRVVAGEYVRPWLHDVEHLTIDHAGFVYWRGQHVEHYSHSDRDRQADDARQLGARCARLEGLGLSVNASSALFGESLIALAEHPDVEGLAWARARDEHALYTIGQRASDGSAVMQFWISHSQDPNIRRLVALRSHPGGAGGEPEIDVVGPDYVSSTTEPHELYYRLRDQGYQSCPASVLDQAQPWLDWTRIHGFTVERVAIEVAAAQTRLEEQTQAWRAAQRPSGGSERV